MSETGYDSVTVSEKPDAEVEVEMETLPPPLPMWQRLIMAFTPFSYGPKDAKIVDHPLTALIDLTFIILVVIVVAIYAVYCVDQAMAKPPQETRTTYTMSQTFAATTTCRSTGGHSSPRTSR